MSTTEPDSQREPDREAPIPLPEFERVLRGYDPQAVTSFLRTALGRIRELEGKVIDLQSDLDEARARGGAMPASGGAASQDRYDVFSGHVAEVVRAFDQDVGRIRAEAEAEAARLLEEAKARAEASTKDADERNREVKTRVERMLEEARAEADRIRVGAQAKAEEIKGKADRALDDARARATEFLSDLDSRRSSMIADMRSLRDRMLEAAAKLDAGLDDRPAGDVTVAEKGVAVSEGPERSELSGRGL